LELPLKASRTKQSVGRTALGTATCRLIEQYQPESRRLFTDPVAKEMVGAVIRFLMWFASMRNFTVKQTDASTPGIFGAQICRTRYIDDAVEQALAQGIVQVVILGAGLDTRPYRLRGMEGVRAFEVDLPAVQKDKMKKVQSFLGKLPERVSFIPIDFDTQILEEVFAGTAFDPSRPAVFVWEGVTQYISEEAVRQTLAFTGKSAPGSVIVFTYVLKSIIEGRSGIPGMEKLTEVVAKNNAPWIFGLEPEKMQEFLKPFRLRLMAEVGNTDYQEMYLKPMGRKLVVSEGERIVQARVD
jgi:methyltransferase (TIGR00027 family)